MFLAHSPQTSFLDFAKGVVALFQLASRKLLHKNPLLILPLKIHESQVVSPVGQF